MRRIGILTRDFALYHDLVKYLREQGISFSSLAFDEIPSPQVGVVLTSWKDVVTGGLPEGLPVAVVPPGREGDDVEAGIQSALRILEGRERFHEVAVGVDPGQRPGVAVLGDLRIVHTAHATSPIEAAAMVRRALTYFQSDHFVIRVGHGAPRERDEILRRLRPLLEEGVRIEVVDERGTTPPTGSVRGKHPDVAAAERIARTPGRRPRWLRDASGQGPREGGGATRRNRSGSR